MKHLFAHGDRVEADGSRGSRVAPGQEPAQEPLRSAREPACHKANFTAAWLPKDMVLEGYTDGRVWRRRWGMPKFTFEQGQRLFNDLAGLAYDRETDSFTLPLPEYGPNEQQVFAGETITVNGKPVKVYAIGAGSWCWDPPH